MSVASSVEFKQSKFVKGVSLHVTQKSSQRADYILVGGHCHLAFLMFMDNELKLLRYFENLHSAEITGLGILGCKIFTVGQGDSKVNHIYIPENAQQSNKLMNKA